MSLNRNMKYTAVLLVAASVLLALPQVHAANLKPGDALPALKAKDFEGALPELAGKVVLLDFWASWCGPCKASLPQLDKLYREYGKRGFVILGVSVDESSADMKAFLEAHPVSFPTVRDKAQTLVGQVSVDVMPTSLLINREGKVTKIHSGYQGEKTVEELRAEIEQLLGAP